MLVLTRKAKEAIYIDRGLIRITVVAFKNGQVKLGIDAPPEIEILRGELLLDACPQIAGNQATAIL